MSTVSFTGITFVKTKHPYLLNVLEAKLGEDLQKQGKVQFLYKHTSNLKCKDDDHFYRGIILDGRDKNQYLSKKNESDPAVWEKIMGTILEIFNKRARTQNEMILKNPDDLKQIPGFIA